MCITAVNGMSLFITVGIETGTGKENSLFIAVCIEVGNGMSLFITL